MLHQVARLSVLVVVICVGLIGGASPRAQQPEESKLAGCLQPSANEGEFVLVADDKQMYRIQAAEGVEVASHANQRVEVTGTLEKSETDAVLKVTTLKMVATSCAPI
jgi:hypothetical protein